MKRLRHQGRATAVSVIFAVTGLATFLSTPASSAYRAPDEQDFTGCAVVNLDGLGPNEYLRPGQCLVNTRSFGTAGVPGTPGNGYVRTVRHAAVFQTDRNFVIYKIKPYPSQEIESVVWNSGVPPADHPGVNAVRMQNDGNLVIQRDATATTPKKVYCHTNTYGNPGAKFSWYTQNAPGSSDAMAAVANMWITTTSGVPLWRTNVWPAGSPNYAPGVCQRS